MPPPDNAKPTNSLPAPPRSSKINLRSLSMTPEKPTASLSADAARRLKRVAIVTPRKKRNATPAMLKFQMVQSPPSANRKRPEPADKYRSTEKLSKMSDGMADRTARDSRRPALYKLVVLGNDRTANLQASDSVHG